MKNRCSHGSVKKRTWKTKDGKTGFAWHYVYNDENGKKQRAGGFGSQKEALDAMERAKNSKPIPSEIKNIEFNNFAQRYIEEHCRLYCKPSTITSYEANLNKNFYPFFFNKKLVEINPTDIKNFILELTKPQKVKRIEKRKTDTGKTIKLKKEIDFTLSNKSINNNIVLLTAIFNYAIELGLIDKSPAEKIKKLQLPHQEMDFYTTKEVFKILDTAKQFFPNFYPVVFTALFTSMRKGELLALTWSDIDFKNKTITINKSLYKGEKQDPKTKSSIRKIDMVDDLVEALRTHKKRTKILTKYVFHNSLGNPLCPDNLVKRDFKKLIEKAEVKKIRWHDLRHTYASLLISKNLPIKYIQKQMGHSSIQTTLNIYGHLMPDVNEQAISVLNSLFSDGHNFTKIKDFPFLESLVL